MKSLLSVADARTCLETYRGAFDAKRTPPLVKALDQIAAGNFSAAVSHGFGAKVAAGETTFHGKPIPEQLAYAFLSIIDAAAAAESAAWKTEQDQTGETDPRTVEEIDQGEQTSPAPVPGWDRIDTSTEDTPADESPDVMDVLRSITGTFSADAAANLAHIDAGGEPAEVITLADPFTGGEDAPPVIGTDRTGEIESAPPAFSLTDSANSPEPFQVSDMRDAHARAILPRMIRAAYRHQWTDPDRTAAPSMDEAQESAYSVLFWIMTRPPEWFDKRNLRRGDWLAFARLANGVGRRMKWRTPEGESARARSSRAWSGQVRFDPATRILSRYHISGIYSSRGNFPRQCAGMTVIVNGITCRIEERLDGMNVRLDKGACPSRSIPAPAPESTGDVLLDMILATARPQFGRAHIPRQMQRTYTNWQQGTPFPNPARQVEAWDERNPAGVKRIGYEQLRFARTVWDKERRYLAAYGAGYEERTTGRKTSVPGGKGRNRRQTGKGWGELIDFPAGEIPETVSRFPGSRRFELATVAGDWSLTPEDFDSDLRRCRGDRPEQTA